jgi:peptidoglycan/LPS O-acetylase OafA/YrhL
MSALPELSASLSTWPFPFFIARSSVSSVDELSIQLGFALAFLMMVAGVAVICEQLARLVPPGDPRISGAATQVLRLLGFAILVYSGYRLRQTPPAHKRLMLIATITLLPAAFVRWPVLISGNFLLALACCLALLVLVACYELWSTRKIQQRRCGAVRS